MELSQAAARAEREVRALNLTHQQEMATAEERRAAAARAEHEDLLSARADADAQLLAAHSLLDTEREAHAQSVREAARLAERKAAEHERALKNAVELSEQAGARKRKRLEEQHRSAEEDLRVTIRDLRDELTRGQKRTSELVATLRSDLQDARRDASLRASDARAKNAKAALELREEIARRERRNAATNI